jgi:ketosteroid isomerase-like protein
MDRTELTRWVDAYERAWRAPGVAALGALFAEDATYSTAPFERPFSGLAAIEEMWERGREPGEAFEMAGEIVAVEGDTGVVQMRVHYGPPHDQDFLDIWIVRLDAEGRCTAFEEWPFWPPGSRGGYDPGPAS